ncbi:MAG TPA: GNAT family N-acetyltransferase [Actinomycetota bacterium]|nr:GNAT family N-acetyltransferase [Actinomycetota bacterium]
MLPEAVRGFWYRLGEAGGRTRRTAWGFVRADARYPLLHEANMAAVLEEWAGLQPEDVRSALLPLLEEAGASHDHVEFWASQASPAVRALRAEGWGEAHDALMGWEGGRPTLPSGPVVVREVSESEPGFLPWYRASRHDFGEQALAPAVVDQLLGRHLEVLRPLGLRWFVGFLDGEMAGLASLVSLDGVRYVDSVVTAPRFRRRGVATATVLRTVRESLATGDRTLHLLAVEGGKPQRLYERLGFRVWGRVVTFNRPRLLAPAPGTGGSS